jgi:uncharacterized protein YeaO (DUF488 family)
MTIKTDKTIYDEPGPSDGLRVLVMRLWPRGISKDKVDLWVKEVGTERELIKLWKGGKLTWKEYSKRYIASLKGKESILDDLAVRAKHRTITLLCVEKDADRCHRSLLKKQIENRL